jgi:hypothetical protein
MLAIANGCEEAIEILAAQGTSIHQEDATGSAPLIVAAKHSNEVAARLLLEHGADPNAADHEERPALMHAYGGRLGQKDKNVMRAGGALRRSRRSYLKGGAMCIRRMIRGGTHMILFIRMRQPSCGSWLSKRWG